MKHQFFLKQHFLKSNLCMLIATPIVLFTSSLCAQIGPIGLPNNGVELRSSNRGMVNHFHKDNKGNDEDFYFSSGSGNWRNRIQFRIHTNGTISTTNGLHADVGHLYLVADWDNNSGSEDIIFGFDNHVRRNVRERMRLTDEGNLGIGTSSPKEKLHVNGDIYTRGHMYLYAYEGEGRSGTAYLQARDKSSTSKIGLQLRSKNGPDIINALKISPNGSIGIGTTTPKEKFHINTNTYAKGNLQLFANEGENQSGTAYVQAKDKSGNSNIGLQFRTQKEGNFINALKIDSNGNLGIGITTPTEKLDVQGNITTATGNHMLLKQGTLSDHKGLFLVADRDNDAENEDIIFGFDGNTRESIQEKMRLTDEGYLGIGTNAPSEKLEVLGKIKATSFVTSLQSFPDYVFDKEYPLQPLSEIKKYVETYRHLPGMPSENEVIKNGLDIKEVMVVTVEKIEELYLHTMAQQRMIEEQKKMNSSQLQLLNLQQKMVKDQELMIKKLEQRITSLEKSK